jgi:hypothetical protein
MSLQRQTDRQRAQAPSNCNNSAGAICPSLIRVQGEGQIWPDDDSDTLKGAGKI